MIPSNWNLFIFNQVIIVSRLKVFVSLGKYHLTITRVG